MGVRRQRQVRVELAHGHRDDVGHGHVFSRLGSGGGGPSILPGARAAARRTLGHRGYRRLRRAVTAARGGCGSCGARPSAALLAAEVLDGRRRRPRLAPVRGAAPAGRWPACGGSAGSGSRCADGELLVDDARLPAARSSPTRSRWTRPAGARCSGVGADPLAFVVQRPWVGRRGAGRARRPGRPDAVLGGQHPRDPERLAAAIAAAGQRAVPSMTLRLLACAGPRGSARRAPGGPPVEVAGHGRAGQQRARAWSGCGRTGAAAGRAAPCGRRCPAPRRRRRRAPAG